MTAYRIAPGRTIQHEGGASGHPSPCDWLIPADVALYLADGTIEPIPSPSPDSLPAPSEAPAPVESEAVPPADDEGAGAPLEMPERLPSLGKLAAHLDGQSEEYIRAMHAADSRKGQTAQGHYKRALKALGVSL